jgi:hypothetical protein
LVVEPLMVPLRMVVREILADGIRARRRGGARRSASTAG